MTDTYTAGDFLKKLSEGALRTPLICEGFAKPVEACHDAFLFSLGMSCKDWTKIPIEVIEKVKFLGERSCHDHSHPLIRIHFKDPSANEPFAAVLSSLLRASNPRPIHSPPLLMLEYPGIGEWLARVIADAVWYGGAGGAGGGGGGLESGDNRPEYETTKCIEWRRRCWRGDLYACRKLRDEC